MTRNLIALAAAGAIGAAGLAMPTKAEATPAWVVPVIIAAGVGGLVLGGAAVAASDPAYAYYGPGYGSPRGSVYVRPTGYGPRCYWVRERTPWGPRDVEICR
jgi:hypothetical protein